MEHRTRIWRFSPISGLDAALIKLAVLIAAILLLPMLTGCQQSAPDSKPKPPIAATPLPANRQPTADEALASDPCSTQLENIEGALLMYYALNKRMPDSLEQLKPFADAGTELKLTCPVSNQPYVYSPAGLVAVGTSKRIIVWDPTPAHQGMRWCIIMPPIEHGAALVPQVVPIGEKAFEAFVPPIQ